MMRQVAGEGYGNGNDNSNGKATQQDSKTDRGKKLKNQPAVEFREVVKEREEAIFVPEESGVDISMESLYNFDGCEEPHWSWLAGGIVDEQMSWGSSWLPSWDVEVMGEAYRETFNDVMWDDDIWNLRGINQVPNEQRRR